MARTDIVLYLGETWTIDGIASDKDGNAIDLTDGAIEFRMGSATNRVLKLTSDENPQVDISEGASGSYVITVQDDDDLQTAVPVGNYIYEVVSIKSDGGVTIQNRGMAHVYKSLRSAFP